jgi:hypothetical protein
MEGKKDDEGKDECKNRGGGAVHCTTCPIVECGQERPSHWWREPGKHTTPNTLLITDTQLTPNTYRHPNFGPASCARYL